MATGGDDERQPLLQGSSTSPIGINDPNETIPYLPIKPSQPIPDDSGAVTTASISTVGLESVQDRFRLHRQREQDRQRGPDLRRSRSSSVRDGVHLRWAELTVALPPKKPSLLKRLFGTVDETDSAAVKCILQNGTVRLTCSVCVSR